MRRSNVGSNSGWGGRFKGNITTKKPRWNQPMGLFYYLANMLNLVLGVAAFAYFAFVN